MTKAVRKAMVCMSSINVASSAMYQYSVTLCVMKDAAPISKAKGNCYVTSAQHYLRKCLQNKQYRLWIMQPGHTQRSEVNIRNYALLHIL